MKRLDRECEGSVKFSSYVAPWQTRELYNVTLAEYSRGVQSKEFIAMMHPVNRCSFLARGGIWTHRQLGIFPRTSNLKPLTSRISLLFPRVSVRVIPVPLPET